MTLELYVIDDNGIENKNIEYPLLKIIADDMDERQYLQVPNGDGFVEIPISFIKKMIKIAEIDVHSETWFDKNVFDKYNNE